MSTKSNKQIGDLVHIVQGQHRGEDGILRDRTQRGWLVELATGEKIDLMFPFVRLKARKGTFESEGPWRSVLTGEITEAETTIQNALESPCTASEETGNETVTPGENTVKAPTGAAGNGIEKMTTLQLRELAKQKGVAIARTKADFHRLIKEKTPDEDLERLKGKVLFDRVSELHISRLRSKEDLQKLLAQS